MPATPKNSAPAAKTAPAKAAPAGATATPAERQAMIAKAAYFIAQQRGFGGGNEAADWIQAEQQVDLVLKKLK